MASGSGNVSNVLQLGGVNSTDNLIISETNSQGYITLYAGPLLTANHFDPFVKNGVAYQVPVGKTFQVVKICGAASTGGLQGWQLVSATASFVKDAVSITGPVYQGGQSGTWIQPSSATASTYICTNNTYAFAASTFPGIQVGSGATYSIFIIGKEV